MKPPTDRHRNGPAREGKDKREITYTVLSQFYSPPTLSDRIVEVHGRRIIVLGFHHSSPCLNPKNWFGHSLRPSESEDSRRVLPSLHQRRRRRWESSVVRRQSYSGWKPYPRLPHLHRRSWCFTRELDGSCYRSIWRQTSFSTQGDFLLYLISSLEK